MAKKELQEINASSMADIAFLLLIFFLVTTTMDVDTGLMRQLPPIPEKKENTSIEINERNILPVLISAQGWLMVNKKVMDIGKLKEEAKKFIRSDINNPKLPEMIEENISGIPASKNPVLVPQGLISLQNDRGTTYGRYIEVQNILVAAYNEIRDEAASHYFGKNKYDDLTTEQQDAIKAIYPQKISEAEPKNIGGNR